MMRLISAIWMLARPSAERDTCDRARGTGFLIMCSDPSSTATVARVGAECSRSLLSLISQHAERGRDRPAIAHRGRTLTYAELERQSNDVALRLRASGAGPASCVALLLDRSPDFIVAALAVWKTGGAYLPLDSATPPARLALILADAGVELILTDGPRSRSWPQGPWHTLDLAAARRSAEGTSELLGSAEPSPDSLAYVIYTSGTAGRPKGVEISHANVLNLVDWHIGEFAVTSADRASHIAGLGFDAAVWEIWPHLASGATVYIAEDSVRHGPLALR